MKQQNNIVRYTFVFPYCNKVANASKDMQVVHRKSKEALLSIA